ncbi:MAG TPA: Ada metal-binding domain-containing protein [Chryseolinea sp.]|nr:Ada metal-binding domain-containing protein [Chryseolinea sp.]
MIEHKKLSDAEVRSLIHGNKITYAGNIPAKIYGTLTCSGGKRMKKENRTFFVDRNEAILAGFRPCGKCLHQEYRIWKERTLTAVK